MITPENSTMKHGYSTAPVLPQRETQPEWLPLAAGAAVVFLALSRKRTLFSLGALLGGGYLLYRAAESGSLRLPKDLESLGLPSDMTERLRSQWRQVSSGLSSSHSSSRRNGNATTPEGIDLVDEASMESFPGSDPPATW